jgi:uncharacterized protein YcnI
MSRLFFSGVALAGSVLLGVSMVSAHVIVTPSKVGIATTQTFSVSVPSEKDGLSVTTVRLLIPAGMKEVIPSVHPGWKIEIKKDAKDVVTEIDWTGGPIPGGQRDDLTFNAQVPVSATTVNWKAYQTYSDGTVVSWDQAPVAGKETDDSLTPYSVTAVVNDLATSTSATKDGDTNDSLARVLSVVAIALSAFGLVIKKRS